jgi:hypothetical protein
MLSQIDPTLSSTPQESETEASTSDTAVTNVKPRNVLVTEYKVAEALRRLASLLSSHPNPGLSKRLLDRVLLPLWSLSSWAVGDSAELEEQWRAPAQFLLQILLPLASDGKHLMTIAQNLLYEGNLESNKLCWVYRPGPAGGIQIEKGENHDRNPSYFDDATLRSLDGKVDAFVNLIKLLKDSDDVPALFISLCKRWLLGPTQGSKLNGLLMEQEGEDMEGLESRIIDAKLIQKMIDGIPDRLVSDSRQITELVSEVLDRVISSGEDLDGDDTVAVALSLLNIVFMSKNFGKSSADQLVQSPLRKSLDIISRRTETEVSATARSVLLLLEFKADDSEVSSSIFVPHNRELEDRKTYSLALSYLTGADSPPPVRAQGLDLLSSLITAKSPILDIPAILVLLSSTLQDDEEYIYLHAIKAFISLSIKHPRAVMLGILERYIDTNEGIALDARLRLGEALLQVVEKAGQTFTGELAQEVGVGLLTIAGRRGYRPMHQAEQQKKAAVSDRKKREAEEAWNGPVPQMEEAPDTEVEDLILAQIVEGWDSKNGEEDVRIRASALSIFGTAIETNIAGLGSSTTSGAVDLCINILALEREHEKAILRRAAILVVMSLVRVLDRAQEEGTKLGFGFAGQSLDDVRRILRYVVETDNDGLVRQHAKDVIEGLGTWQVKGLMVPQQGPQMGLEELAGLSIGSTGTKRPRIEEVE